MPAYGQIDRGFAGLLINGEDFIDGGIVVADAAGIEFGAPVFAPKGIENAGVNAKTDVLSFVLSAAFVASNNIAGAVNGVNYSVDFLTDDATTFAKLVSTFNAIANTKASGNFATRTITIVNTSAASAAAATGTVTGGASQATVTVTTSASVLLLGVAVHSHREHASVAKAEYQSVVNVLRIGKIQVLVGAQVYAGDAAYWDPTAKNWTNVSSSNIATPYRFRTNTASGGLADLDVMKAPVALDA